MIKDLVVGFDIGTSSLKLVILDIISNSNNILLELNKSILNSNITNKEKPNHCEQNVDVIIDSITDLFSQIPNVYFERIKAFQLCGQVI